MKQRVLGSMLVLLGAVSLAACSDDKKYSKFVGACLKHPNSATLPEAKRATVCACYEINQTAVLNTIRDPDVKNVFDPDVDPAKAADPILKVADDPAKGQELDKALRAVADGAAQCRKTEGL